MKNMTRRSFLKNAAFTAAGMTALGMSAAVAEDVEKPAYLPEEWDYEADVVIAGYGVVGAMAAREAISQGVSCLVLEKAKEELAGGAGISSAGAVFPNNPIAMHAESRGYVSMDTIMAIDAEGNRIFNWLMCNGLDMSGFGRTVYLSTRAAADKCGTNVLYETPVPKRLGFGFPARSDVRHHVCEPHRKLFLAALAAQHRARVKVHILFHAAVGLPVARDLDAGRDRTAHHVAPARDQKHHVRTAADQVHEPLVVVGVGDAKLHEVRIGRGIKQPKARMRRGHGHLEHALNRRRAALDHRPHALFLNRGQAARKVARAD